MHMLSKILSLSALAAFVLLSALLQVTSPSTIHPAGILLVYVLLYVLILCVLTLFLVGISKLFVSARWIKLHMPTTKAYYYASVLALAPVVLLAMRSIGKLSMYEVLLIIFFEAIAIFYVSRRY